MANIFKNILDSLKLTEDDDFDDYDDELEEKEAKRAERMERKVEKQKLRQQSMEREETLSDFGASFQEPKKERVTRMERTTNNKVVPIRTTPKGFEVCIMKPTTFEDSQDICDMLLSNRAAVINLEGIDVDLAQRIMDFVSGSVYALNGKLHQISSYIFIISPDSVDISGDYLDLVQSDGFEVPTLNREF
ncbi:cell division protein SepF [Anaerocolumna sp.]|uniref:cell division protein SepF n=1 Tax=Anaerocolumna sp. TaxID=2041569 RepID=UPI0028AA39D2|nr:cell division protein SepF [Anaerocolumna sp.]